MRMLNDKNILMYFNLTNWIAAYKVYFADLVNGSKERVGSIDQALTNQRNKFKSVLQVDYLQ